MIKVSRGVRTRWCSTAILLMFAAAMLAASIAPAYASTGAGNALDFDGTDNYVDCGDINAIDGISKLSIEAWVNWRTLGQLSTIVSKRNDHWDKIQFESGGSGGTNGVQIQIGADSLGWGYTTGDIISTDTWYHVAMVFDGSKTDDANRLKFYLDGVPQPLTYSGTLPSTTCNNSAVVTVGAETYTAGMTNVDARVDEVRIWNTARTEAQICENMNKKLTGSESGLVTYYRFDESSGTLLPDLTPNNNNGTLQNMDDGDWITSCATFGDKSHFGTGTSNIVENADVPVDIIWDGDTPGATAIFAAIQNDAAPDVTAGLLAQYPSTYWELAIANNDGFKADVTFHYDGISGLGDKESAFCVYTRSNAGESWSEIVDITRNNEGSDTDGIGSITVNDLTGFSQFIITYSGIAPPMYTPPDPTNLANTTGNFWVNYTWSAGTGNATDSYNVSLDEAWTNGTENTFMNATVAPSGWANVTVFAYNASGTGTPSAGSMSDEVQAPSAPAASPDITSSAPESPVNDSYCTWRTFNVSVDQIVDVTWYLDGTAQTPVNVSVTETSYTLHADDIREHNVSAVAENANGTDMQTWVWNVTGESTLPAVTINTPTTASPIYITGGEQFRVNFTYTELYPASYTVKVGNSTAIINSITRTSVDGGTDMTANEIFYLDSTAADGWYNVSVELYDISSNCNIAYQNYSVSKGIVNVLIDSATICRDPSCRATVNITLNNIRNYGSGTIHLYFDETFVKVNSIGVGESDTVIPNRIEAGHWIISASNFSGISGNVVFATVTFEHVELTSQSRRCAELELVVETLYDRSFSKLAPITSNGSICNGDPDAPILTIPIASPQTILNDNGRARVPGTNITRITATVTDDTGVDNVTINLTPIRGPGNGAVAMTLVEGTEKAGIWSIDTNADYDPGVNLIHNLTVIATDYSGNSKTAGATLTVLRRGDVDRNNVINMGDYNEIAMYIVGLKPAPDELVAGVVAADRFDGVDMADALYILMHIYGGYPAP